MAQAEGRPVVIISHDVIGKRMAGPGIRYYHLARVLGQKLPVILAVPAHSSPPSCPEFSVIAYHSGEDEHLKKAICQARAVLIPAVWLTALPILLQISVPLIIDGYDPIIAESLALQHADLDELQVTLTQAYLAGDFFICASERQRDWWLGLLEASGRVNTWNFQADPSLRSLVDVVAYGLSETPPQHTHSVIREMWPGVPKNSRIILWGGGLWSWLDPLTAIRAIALVWEQQPDIQLIFPGTHHPNPGMVNVSTYNQAARQLAQTLGLLNKVVFFGDWVPYADWPSVLLESDLALSLHHDTLETRLAFRSRVLEYIWAGVPIVATRGDVTSELVEKYEIGYVVGYEDVNGVAAAILHALNTPRKSLIQQFNVARQALTWEQVAQPLIQFCYQPYRAPDKVTRVESQMGNPFYLRQIAQLQSLVDGYEQGRFIRLMRWLKGLRKMLWSGL